MMEDGNPIQAGIGMYAAMELMMAKAGIPPSQIMVSWQYSGDLKKVNHNNTEDHFKALLEGRLISCENFSVDFDGIDDLIVDDALRIANNSINKIELLGKHWLASADAGEADRHTKSGVLAWSRVMFAAASWARGWGSWFGSDSFGPKAQHSLFELDPWKCASKSSALAVCCNAKTMKDYLALNLSM